LAEEVVGEGAGGETPRLGTMMRLRLMEATQPVSRWRRLEGRQLGLSKAKTCSLDRGCRRSHGGGAALCGGGKGLVICIFFFLSEREEIWGDGN
jgi:hypothetical protein